MYCLQEFNFTDKVVTSYDSLNPKQVFCESVDAIG